MTSGSDNRYNVMEKYMRVYLGNRVTILKQVVTVNSESRV